MHTVTSFEGSAVEPEEVSVLIAEYLAVERARIWRRLLTTRCVLLGTSIVVSGLTLRWLPPLAYWISGALCAVAPISAWIVELRRDWRLGRHLEGIPGGQTYVVSATPTRKRSSDSEALSEAGKEDRSGHHI